MTSFSTFLCTCGVRLTIPESWEAFFCAACRHYWQRSFLGRWTR